MENDASDADTHLNQQAGNHDYPRAGNPSRLSVPPSSSDRRSDPPTFRHLREVIESGRQGERQQRLATLESEILQMSEDPNARMERRRRNLDAHFRGMESSTAQAPEMNRASPEPTSSRPSPAIMRARRRAHRPSGILQRYAEQSDSPGPSELERIRSQSRLIDPRSTLSPLDERPPRIGSPDLLTQEYSGEAQVNSENRWRAKRRKLDSDDTRDSFKGFNYGHYGQVVPGPLKMEIVSCDGGQYSEPNGDRSGPEHVLQDDSTVYCTKSDRCNMVLRHLGETPFCLKKLVIKAPKSGFDAAIQEGMIFVSMERDDLLARTSSYQIQYSPHRRRRRPEQGQIRLQPSQEYMNSVRSPLRSIDASFRQTSSNRVPTSDPPRTGDPNFSFASTTSGPDTQDVTHPDIPRVPDFRVITDYDDKSDDGSAGEASEREDASVAAEIEFERLLSLHDHYLSRYGDLVPRHTLESEDESSEDDAWDENFISGLASADHDFASAHMSRRRQYRLERWRNRRRLTPSRIQVAPTLESPNDQGNGSRGRLRNAQEPLVPHASFFIRRDKDMVAIKFDPPVSGKFILIKLWAPCPNANIDIQSIIAHGYAGPRFFPAITIR